MILRIPRFFKIGSHTYETVFDTVQGDREFRGTFADKKHQIFLNPDQHPQQTRVTFWHELIHLICCYGDIGMPDQDVNRIAEGTVEFLVRNLDIDFDFSEVPVVERRPQE